MKSETDVRALVAALGEAGARRESAIARLIILGTRAVPRLVSEFQATDDRGRQIAILRILEAIGDERALGVATLALSRGADVAVAAVAVLRELLGKRTGSVDVEALDLLLAAARDTAADHRVRAAAREALDNAPEDVREAVKGLGQAESAGDALWKDAVAGHLPDDPRELRQTAADCAPDAPLAELRRLIETIGARERTGGKAGQVEDWRAVRGAIHQALALRGSRIALYDLRETLAASAAPLPGSFVAAVQMIGDESCLEPLAVAYAAAGAHPRWRHQVAQAFRDIVKRERLTRRHSALRRALAKAPDLEQLLQ